MFSKIWLINLVLAALVALFGMKIHDVWTHKDTDPVGKSAPAKTDDNNPVAKLVQRKLPPVSAFEGIVDKNLFSEDRSEYIPPEPPAAAEEPEPDVPANEEENEEELTVEPFDIRKFGRKITLYGVMKIGKTKKALINNPDRKRDSKKNIWVEEGNTVLELKKRGKTLSLTVNEILTDRVLFASGADRYEVLLYDKNQPKKRVSIKKSESARVLGEAVEKAKTGRSGQTKKKTTKRKRVKRPRKKKTDVKPKGVPVNTTRKVSNPSEESETISTPFGEIKRKKN